MPSPIDVTDVAWGGKLALIEALLFASPDPVAPDRLAEASRLPETEVRMLLNRLQEVLKSSTRGLVLQEVAGGFRLYTKPEFADAVARLMGPRNLGLTQAALETLAVVAYRQPATRVEIDAVRGVRSESTVATLVERRLIREVGRKEAVGRPIMYGTTPQFLEHFGLRDLAELPPLKEAEAGAEEQSPGPLFAPPVEGTGTPGSRPE